MTFSKPSILVVEDEPLIRMTAVDELEDVGFIVFEAANADEALNILASNPDIQSMFTDVDMPGSMNGVELALAARALRPEMNVIVTSGFLKVPRSILPEHMPFFAKPYEMRSIIDAIRSASQ